MMVSKTKQKESDAIRKRKVVTSLYYYSDLSVRNIAQQVDLPIREVEAMINSLTKSDSIRLLAEQTKTRVDKIMSMDVACLDHSKTASDELKISIDSFINDFKGGWKCYRNCKE